MFTHLVQFGEPFRSSCIAQGSEIFEDAAGHVDALNSKFTTGIDYLHQDEDETDREDSIQIKKGVLSYSTIVKVSKIPEPRVSGASTHQ